jgi:hypothetical protein
MYINGEKYGHAPLPLPRPQPAGTWRARPELTASLDTKDGLDGSTKIQNPPFMMVGCHRTSDDSDYRNYGYPNTQYDELSFWNRRLVTNQTVDESLYFQGGYLDGYEDIDKEVWSKVMQSVHLIKI